MEESERWFKMSRNSLFITIVILNYLINNATTNTAGEFHLKYL